jgi:phospholipase C
MTDLSKIDTIIVVMMENRSFDHLLGYLSLPPYNRKDVDGLKSDMKNTFMGTDYPVYHLPSAYTELPADPPHERINITIQLIDEATPDNAIPTPPPYPMSGFVHSYSLEEHVDASHLPIPMGYHVGEELPAADFFASQFCICDRWFASLPTGTQPNRLMAFSGFSLSDVNQSFTLPNQYLVYDWLNDHKIRWRVYHQGIPFFMLMDGWHIKCLTDSHFRDFDDFQDDINTEADDTFPQVIFIEPRYADAPHVEAPTDDHPPTPIINGQQFLLKIYSDLIGNPDRWSRTVMIVTYDENGGFFDHVSPMPIETKPPTGADYPPFLSTGPRVPGFVISPFVNPGSVFKGALDHTSILKFIAQKFADGFYSPEVDGRAVGDLTKTLTLDTARTDIPTPSGIGNTPEQPPSQPTPLAFRDAITRAAYVNPVLTAKKFPELFTHFDEYSPPKPGSPPKASPPPKPKTKSRPKGGSQRSRKSK